MNDILNTYFQMFGSKNKNNKPSGDVWDVIIIISCGVICLVFALIL